MKKSLGLLAFFLCLLMAFSAQATEAAEATPEPEEPTEFSIDALFLTTVFPVGWTPVTPETVPDNMEFFDADSPDIAAALLRAEGVYAVAFSPDGDAAMRVLAQPGDETAALYYDIDRYTPAMRTEIKDGFLDKKAWALTGYRYSEAEWTNKQGQGRLLRLTYSVRIGEETISRGRQAYTIRNGTAFTLDLQVQGKDRKVSAEEARLFDSFVDATIFPASTNMPLLPVGLELTSPMPEETYKAELTYKGITQNGAQVAAFLLPSKGEAIELGKVQAESNGAFTLDVVLPEAGDFRLYLVASMSGYADSEAGGWVNYSPRRIPVSFISLPSGVYTESQVIISGKTLPNVTIQCMEGENNKKAVTGSSGEFSFKLDRAQLGKRTATLSMTKEGFDNRRFDISFDRQWKMADYVKYLSDKTQSLSYKNLSTRAEEFIGRLVKYSGKVMDITDSGVRTYVRFATDQGRDGTMTNQIVAIKDGDAVDLEIGASATLYVEVTKETYALTELDKEGDEVTLTLPAVTLIAYEQR